MEPSFKLNCLSLISVLAENIFIYQKHSCGNDLILCNTFYNYASSLVFHFILHLQGLISGSAELREQAAQGLGELIEVTSEQALKEFVIPITGYVMWLFCKYALSLMSKELKNIRVRLDFPDKIHSCCVCFSPFFSLHRGKTLCETACCL